MMRRKKQDRGEYRHWRKQRLEVILLEEAKVEMLEIETPNFFPIAPETVSDLRQEKPATT